MKPPRDPYGYIVGLFVDRLVESLKRQGIETQGDGVKRLVREPPNPDYGDLGVPVHKYARELGLNPVELATRIASDIAGTENVLWARQLAGYVNIKYDPVYIARLLYSCIYIEA